MIHTWKKMRNRKIDLKDFTIHAELFLRWRKISISSTMISTLRQYDGVSFP